MARHALSRRRLSLGPLERLASVRTFETGPGASSPTIHEGRRQTALQRKSDRSRETRSRRIFTEPNQHRSREARSRKIFTALLSRPNSTERNAGGGGDAGADGDGVEGGDGVVGFEAEVGVGHLVHQRQQGGAAGEKDRAHVS